MPNQEFKSTVTIKEGLFVEAEARGFKINLDEPAELGGTDKAMTPVEMLLSALGGCIAITFASISKAMRVEIRDLKVNLTGDLDPAGFLGLDKDVRKGFSQIRYNIEVDTDASQEKIEKLMKMVEEKCPVSDTLKGVEVVPGNVSITVNN